MYRVRKRPKHNLHRTETENVVNIWSAVKIPPELSVCLYKDQLSCAARPGNIFGCVAQVDVYVVQEFVVDIVYASDENKTGHGASKSNSRCATETTSCVSNVLCTARHVQKSVFPDFGLRTSW